MTAGAIALSLYSVAICHLLIRMRMNAVPATLLASIVWLVASFGLLILGGAQA